MLPLRRAGVAVAPSFAWDGVRSGGSSEEKGTLLTYEARDDSPAFSRFPGIQGSRGAVARLIGDMATYIFIHIYY